MSSSSSWYSTHHLLEEADHHIWVYERRVVSYEGLGDVGHDAGVVPWKSFSSIHLHTETSPGSLRGKTFWYQQVPEEKDVMATRKCISTKLKLIHKDFLTTRFISNVSTMEGIHPLGSMNVSSKLKLSAHRTLKYTTCEWKLLPNVRAWQKVTRSPK